MQKKNPKTGAAGNGRGERKETVGRCERERAMNPACNELQSGDAVPRAGQAVPRAGETVPRAAEAVPCAGGDVVPRAGDVVPRAGDAGSCDRPDAAAPGRSFRRCDQVDPGEAPVDCYSMTDACERKKKCCVPPPMAVTNTCPPPPPPPAPAHPQRTPGGEPGSQPPSCSGARFRTPANRNFCCRTTNAKGCCDFALTEYGREYVLRTGKVVSDPSAVQRETRERGIGKVDGNHTGKM